MVKYTKKQLNIRKNILETQPTLCSFLDSNMVNLLVHLFDKSSLNDNVPKISNYIQNERILQGLNNSNIRILHKVYGLKNGRPSFHLGIEKNKKEILHLTIHLCVEHLNSENAGVIHMYKNIYKTTSKKNSSLYVLIHISQIKDKPNSLHFSINEDTTTGRHDAEIKKELDIIISVLNKLFDENNKEYIGLNERFFVPIYPITNNILNKINTYNKFATRKNKHVKMNPQFTTNAPIHFPRTSHKTQKRTSSIRRNKIFGKLIY